MSTCKPMAPRAFPAASRRAVVLAAVVVAASAWPALAAADAAAPAVVAGIAHGALVVRADGGPARALQQGGGARSLPVWSADGRRIAFVQAIDPHQGLADVVVVDTDGRERARVTIEPVQPGMAYAGMRGVESLRWLSATRLAVRGSLNPSQSQYDVVDTTSGQVVDDFTDDRSSAAFSPDGLHVASQAGSPHFTPADRRAPTMSVDGRVVYPPSGSAHAGQVFLSPPRWSDDGHALAWVVRDAGATHPALALWRDGAVREVALPAAGWQAARVAWSGTRVLVRPVDDDGGPVAGARPAGWSVDARSGRVDAVADAAAVDPLAAARALRERLRAQARANGLAMPDVWCAHCALAVLPRESD